MDATITALMFHQFGWTRIILSDDGPAFRSGFGTWARSMNVVHEMAAAYHLQSNGVGEGAVRKAKDVIKRCTAAREDIEQPCLR